MVLTFNQYHSLWSQSVQVQSTVKCTLFNYTSDIKREPALFVQDQAIKARRSHFWSQSHFSSIYSFTESEIEIIPAKCIIAN